MNDKGHGRGMGNLEWGWDNARAILGIVLITGIAWLLSENKKKFPWLIAVGAVVMMYAFTLLLFGVPIIRAGLDSVNEGINVLIAATREGTKFVFGPIIGDQTAWEQLVGAPGPIFIFQLLPLIIVIGSLSAILWHWGILKWITRGFALIFQRTMGMGGPTSLSVAANIFMGQTEAPLLIKPYLKIMTRSELLIVMATGFATIAGSVLVVYVTLLRDTLPSVAAHLITVSIIASPAAVALSMIMVPETEGDIESLGRDRLQVPLDHGRLRHGRDGRHRHHLEHRHHADRGAGAGVHHQRHPRRHTVHDRLEWRAAPAQPRHDPRLAVLAADVHGRRPLGRGRSRPGPSWDRRRCSPSSWRSSISAPCPPTP